MLLELNVKDIALIKKASVEFSGGLNILTGETGTGKSVIIDSVLLALGGKVRGDMVRTGAEYAYIELIFSVDDETRAQKLKELSVFPDENGEIIISRRIMQKRSVSKVNDETVTISRLAEITSLLIDIYGQNEFHTLMNKSKHLEILDEFTGADGLRQRSIVSESYREYKSALRELDSFSMDEKERLREEDILSYELNEIENAAVGEGEEEELSQLYKKLNNARNILDYIGSAHRILEDTAVEKAVADVESAMRYDEELKQIYDELLDAQAVIESAVKDISSYADGLDVDEYTLKETEDRLDLIRNLKAKYGQTTEDIRNYKEKTEKRLDELKNYDDNRKKAGKILEEAEKKLRADCAALSKIRRQGAEKLGRNITAELKDLGFEKAVVSMDVREKEPGENGCDEVCFMAALNPGESLKPLNEAASGGELSRVMLAIKTILARTDDMPTLIFDEIDTGISGRTAQRVAEKMDAIAGSHQVICVSHLPQIAAMADTHFVIKKEEEDGRNITEISRLDEKGACEELARLLGGASITKAVMENALEMKRLAGEGKKKRKNQV